MFPASTSNVRAKVERILEICKQSAEIRVKWKHLMALLHSGMVSPNKKSRNATKGHFYYSRKIFAGNYQVIFIPMAKLAFELNGTPSFVVLPIK